MHKPASQRIGKVVSALALLALVLAAAPLATAQLPTLGDGSEMTSAAERRLGDKIARELYRDPDYIDDPLLTDYVMLVWRRLLDTARARGDLTAELDQRFAWEILMGRDRSVNAFALPGGYLGLNLGLVAVVSSRDELSSVLAHELSHVTQRHISRLITQQNRQAPWMLAGLLLGALAARKNPDAAGALVTGGQALAVQNQLSFSRDMEREADRIGYGIMTQGGFEPLAFVTMFDKLQQAARLNDNGSFPYLRTHPMTTERIGDMQARQPGATRPANPAMTLEHAMMAARARVLSGPGVDASRGWIDEAQAAGFDALSPARQAGVLYAAALASSRLRDFAAAQRLQTRLAGLADRDPPAARVANLLAAELALAAGDGRRAASLVPPLATARSEVLLLAQAWSDSGRQSDAAQRLQTWVALHPRDALAWQQLASTQAAQGQTLRAIRSEAEARMAEFDYPAAADRLKAAQLQIRAMPRERLAGSDHIEASIIDTRAREVDLLLREQAAER